MSIFKDLICGTGNWNGPKPGDPNLSGLLLSASATFGGVMIDWNLPDINPHALAYTHIYRSTSNEFDSAIEIAAVAGNRYLDPVGLIEQEFWYWIKPVSVNGTVGEVIGPAYINYGGTISLFMDALTDRIDSGVLAQSLREKIDRIELIGDGLLGESAARERDILDMARTVSGIQAEVEEAQSAILSENLTRISELDALARSFADMTVDYSGMATRVQEEIGILTTELETQASAITVAQGTADGAMAAFRDEQVLRVNADSALADQIGIVEAEVGNNLAQAKTALETQINTVDGKVTEIGALYTAQVTVDGLIGGFGVYNDGTQVEAGFDVDSFWIGRTGTNKRKPFIVQNNDVYIDSARIVDGSIDRVKIGEAAIDEAKIANGAITNAKLADASITNAKIADASITSAKIEDAAITKAKIGTAQVDTLTLAGNAVSSTVVSTARSFNISVPVNSQMVLMFQPDPITSHQLGYRDTYVIVGGIGTFRLGGIATTGHWTGTGDAGSSYYTVATPTPGLTAINLPSGTWNITTYYPAKSINNPGTVVCLILKR